MESGAELVLCGHDHQEKTELLARRVIVSCAGTLSARSRGDRPVVFHRIVIEDDAIQVDGWTLVDLTMFGSQVTETYLREVIRQKVSELKAGAPPVPQSDDPRKPGYAPPMWEPKRVAP